MDRPRDGAEDLRGDFPRSILRSDAHRIRSTPTPPQKSPIDSSHTLCALVTTLKQHRTRLNWCKPNFTFNRITPYPCRVFLIKRPTFPPPSPRAEHKNIKIYLTRAQKYYIINMYVRPRRARPCLHIKKFNKNRI